MSDREMHVDAAAYLCPSVEDISRLTDITVAGPFDDGRGHELGVSAC